MTDRGGAIIFGRILAPPNAPSSSPDATILNYLVDREKGRHDLCRILSPPMPLPDATILNYLNDRERGRHYLL